MHELFSARFRAVRCAASTIGLIFFLASGAFTIRAQEIGEVFIFQGEEYVQSGSLPPSPAAANAFQFRTLALAGLRGSGTSPTVSPPGGTPRNLSASADSSDLYYRFSDSASTLADLNAVYPTGSYTFAYTSPFSGAHTVHINFPNAPIPGAPQITNLSQAQAIDPAQDFTLQWTPWAGASANDQIQVVISDGTGNAVASSPPPGPSGALAGTATEFTIDANTLEAGQTYHATLTFYKVTGTTLALPLSLTAWFSETSFTLATAGSAPVDNDPPTLVEAEPPDNYILPIANYYSFPVSFEFSEQMSGAISIQWSANIDPAKVQYQWFPNGSTPNVTLLATYQNGWPAGAHISWVLNPISNAATNFADAAGNQLSAGIWKGGFMTIAGDSASVCEGADPVQGAGFGVEKAIHNYQNSAGTLVLDTNETAVFKAFYKPTAQTEATLETLEIPALHELKSLTVADSSSNITRIFSQTAANAAALDTAFPAGSYELQRGDIQAQTVASAAFNLSAGDYPAAPHFQNLPASADADLSSGFTVKWEPYASSEGLTVLEVYDQDTNLVFRAPDACLGHTLDADAGSAVIPEGLLDTGADFTFVLSFYKFSDQGKTLPNISGKGFAALSQSTRVSLKPKNDILQVPPPRLHQFLSAAVTNGGLQFAFSAWTGSNYVLEAATNLNAPVHWQTIQIAESKSEILSISDADWKEFPSRFYRIRLLDGPLPVLQTNEFAVVDTSRTVTQTVDDEGGDLTLTSPSGDVYQLHIEPYSLFGFDDISMTLLSSITNQPFSGGFYAGVQFSPPDLPLIVNATLTIQFASALPESLAAAGYHQSDGVFFLEPTQVQGNTITIPVDRLGGIVLGEMTAADTNKFQPALLDYTPDIVLETMALIERNGGAASSQSRAHALHASTTQQPPWQPYLGSFDSVVYPKLLAAQDTEDTDIVCAALNGYIIWWDQVSGAGFISNLATQVDQANNVVKAIINNLVVSKLDRARDHDIDAIIRLSHIRKVINHVPWGSTWVPGQGQALLDMINNVLHMTINLDSSVLWQTAVGDVISKVRGQVEYQPDGVKGTIKGVGEIDFLDHQHYQPAPCSVSSALSSGAFTAFEVSVRALRPAQSGGRYVLKDMRLKYWPGDPEPAENDFISCPGGGSSIPPYWFTTFAYFREKELGSFLPAKASPRPDFVVSGFAVSQTGNPELAKKTYNNTGKFKGADVTEDSTLVLEHTPK
jgi:hypothetical protein